MPTISEQLRQFVNDATRRDLDGGSRYQICKATGWFVSQSQLSAWMKGVGRLSQDKIDALAEAMGLELVKRQELEPVQNEATT